MAWPETLGQEILRSGSISRAVAGTSIDLLGPFQVAEVMTSPPLQPHTSTPGPIFSQERPLYLLLQPRHPLAVGPLPCLQCALRLYLGTAQTLNLLLQLQLLLICLQLDRIVVPLQGYHHLCLQTRAANQGSDPACSGSSLISLL